MRIIPLQGPYTVFENKLDENRIIVRNKARFVGEGYSQEEAIDVKETFAPVDRLDAIHMLLAFVSYMNFMLFQMDAKIALNGYTMEEVYIEKPPGF